MTKYRRFEEIDYDLGIRRGDLRCHRECYQPLLAVLSKLNQQFPEVYEFATDKITYSSGSSSMINLEQELQLGSLYLVILTDNDEFTSAHEIAHAFLGHKSHTEDLTQEDEADALAEKWGYRRPEVK